MASTKGIQPGDRLIGINGDLLEPNQVCVGCVCVWVGGWVGGCVCGDKLIGINGDPLEPNQVYLSSVCLCLCLCVCVCVCVCVKRFWTPLFL